MGIIRVGIGLISTAMTKQGMGGSGGQSHLFWGWSHGQIRVHTGTCVGPAKGGIGYSYY